MGTIFLKNFCWKIIIWTHWTKKIQKFEIENDKFKEDLDEDEECNKKNFCQKFLINRKKEKIRENHVYRNRAIMEHRISKMNVIEALKELKKLEEKIAEEKIKKIEEEEKKILEKEEHKVMVPSNQGWIPLEE